MELACWILANADLRFNRVCAKQIMLVSLDCDFSFIINFSQIAQITQISFLLRK